MRNKILKIVLNIVFICIISINVCYASEFNWPLENTVVEHNPIFLRNLKSANVVSPGYHTGWDMVTKKNPNPYAYAVADGIVDKVEYNNAYNGNWVTIKHTLTEDLILEDINYYISESKDGPMKFYQKRDKINLGKTIYSKYLHLATDTILVSPGKEIKAGMPIAIIGDTGNSGEVHLHFALGSGDGPSKDWDKSLVFTANGERLKTYTRADESTFSEFQSSYYSPNNLCSLSNPNSFVISPSYIFGNYTVEDVENGIDTIYIAKELCKKQINKGYTINTIDYNFQRENRNVYKGILACMYHYGNGKSTVDDVLPKQLNKTVNGTIIQSHKDNAKNVSNQGDNNKNNVKKNNAVRKNFGDITKLNLDFLIDVIAKYAGIITSICMYIGIVAIGIGLILKRNNAEERIGLISALFTIGIGALTVTSAYVIVELLNVVQ